MATTTNYGWTTPDDTALVKDGASAIRTLGTSVDTTTKALNPSTTLGDIEYRSSTANTNTRLGIGSTGTVLTVAGGVPTWAAISSGGYTSLASGSLTGATVSLSSISASYQKLVLVLRNMSLSGSDEFTIRLNGSSSSIYGYYNVFSNSTPEIVSSTAAASIIKFGGNFDAANTAAHIVIEFDDYASAATQIVKYNGAYKRSSYGAIGAFIGVGIADTQTAINAIELKANYGGAYTFDNGTYELFGVK
jgi:hypothetical protein